MGKQRVIIFVIYNLLINNNIYYVEKVVIDNKETQLFLLKGQLIFADSYFW